MRGGATLFRPVQINSPREIEFSTSQRDYLCGNPNRVEILKVGETALGITAAAIRLIHQPRPLFPLYSNMFTYENDAPQVDHARSPLSSPLPFFLLRFYPYFRSPEFPSLSPFPPSFSIPFVSSPLYLYFWPRQRYSTRAYVRYHGYYYIRKSFGP